MAIIASVACCVVEGERGDGKGRVQGGSMADRQTLTRARWDLGYLGRDCPICPICGSDSLERSSISALLDQFQALPSTAATRPSPRLVSS